MNTVKLALSQLKTQFTRQKLLFVLYFAGVVLCCTIFTFYYGSGNYSHTYFDQDKFRTYHIGVEKPAFDQLDVTPFETLEEQLPVPVEDFFYQSYAKWDQLEGVTPSNEFLQSYGMDVFFVCSYRKNATPFHAWLGRSAFTQEELEKGSRVVFAPSELIAALDPNQDTMVTIRGIPFQVIGAWPHFGDDLFFIPYRTMMQEDLPVTAVDFKLERIPTREEHEKIKARLEQLFPGATIETPDIYFNMQNSAKRQNAVTSVGVFLVSFFSFVFLMKYMLDRSRQEMVVYIIVGASKKRLFLLLLLQNCITVLSAGVVAVGAFWALKKPLFDKLAIAPDYQYTPADYAYVLLASVLLSMLVAIPFILHVIRKTPTQLKNDLD